MSEQQRNERVVARVQQVVDQVNAAMRDAGPTCEVSAVDVYRLCLFAKVGCLVVSAQRCPQQHAQSAYEALDRECFKLLDRHDKPGTAQLAVLIASTQDLIYGRLTEFLQEAEGGES